MYIDFLKTVFRADPAKEAIAWRDATYEFSWFVERVEYWQAVVNSAEIKPGTVVMLEADFSPNSTALFLALIEQGCILVPLTKAAEKNKSEFMQIAQAEIVVTVDGNDTPSIHRFGRRGEHRIYKMLRETRRPGLVLFSSGSTGKNKAIVHDMVRLLEKFKVRRHSLRTITFLLYDHIGGVNTMLYTLSNAGLLVTVEDRSPDSILSLIEKYKVELLPTSPTFINLILLSEAYKSHDLSSLRMVTYGTEPMPETTLRRFHELFPRVTMLQTYGLSEIGILRSKSRGSDSLWFKIGGEGFETRVVDGILQVRAQSSMLGYLNAPDPFTEDGWFDTGDAVEVDGEYVRILGRKSEIINIGGEKVYPTEIENVIQEMDNVAEVSVHGERNPIVGNVVCARVRLVQPEDSLSFSARLKIYCSKRLQRYKVPVKVMVEHEKQHSDRFKKLRQPTGA